MASLFIIITTVLVCLVIGQRNVKNNRRIIRVVKELVFEINKTYKEIFKEKSLLIRITQGGMIIGTEIFACISVSASVIEHSRFSDIQIFNSIVKIIVILSICFFIHLAIGYVMLICSKIHKFIYIVEDKNVKVDLILSFFILSTYFTALIISPDKFKSSYIIGLLGVGIGYILNLKVLVKLIRNPQHIKSKEEESTSFKRVIVAGILIVIMIILNLFLAVCFIDSAQVGAFSNNPSMFDLFYYTIITFTTVGYGDIAPLTEAAKVISMLISITSVICITIFLSTILSYREKVE